MDSGTAAEWSRVEAIIIESKAVPVTCTIWTACYSTWWKQSRHLQFSLKVHNILNHHLDITKQEQCWTIGCQPPAGVLSDWLLILPVLLHQWLLSSEPFLIFIQSTWSFFSQPPVQELSYFILCGLIQQHSALSIGCLLKRQEVYSLNALYKADNEFCTFKQRQKPIITVGFLCAYWSGIVKA